MKIPFALAILATLATTTSAVADWRAPAGSVVVGGASVRVGGRYHHHHRPYRSAGVGVYVGTPLLWAWPWGPSLYYPPAVVYSPVVESPQPTVYIERDDPDNSYAATETEGHAALEPGYWYYCRDKGAYYPAVRNCPKAWEKVAPTSR